MRTYWFLFPVQWSYVRLLFTHKKKKKKKSESENVPQDSSISKRSLNITSNQRPSKESSYCQYLHHLKHHYFIFWTPTLLSRRNVQDFASIEALAPFYWSKPTNLSPRKNVFNQETRILAMPQLVSQKNKEKRKTDCSHPLLQKVWEANKTNISSITTNMNKKLNYYYLFLWHWTSPRQNLLESWTHT